MTSVFCCGFECGADASHWAGGTNNAYNTSVVRNGARSMRLNITATTQGVYCETNAITGFNKCVLRGYVRFATLPTNNFPVLTINTSATNQIGIVFNSSDSKLYAGRANADVFTFGSTGETITTDKWYLLDVKIDISANPWLIDGSINGVQLGQLSAAVAATTSSGMAFGKRNGAGALSTTVDMYCDDFVASNTLADYPIGNGYVNHFIPTSDGTHNIAGSADFQRTLTGTDILNATTTAFQLVDDVPLESGAGVDWINMLAPPNATDYVECVFGPASGILVPKYGPRAVEVIAAIHQAGTGTGNMEIRLNDNGSMGTVYTATGVAGVTTIAYKRAHFSDPPSAATVWGIASGNGNFNNVRVRFGSPAALDVNPDQYFDSIMIEAEFAEWPQKIIQIKQAVSRSNFR